MKDLKSVKVSHKFHLLLEHVPQIADRDKTIGFFSEHVGFVVNKTCILI